MIKFYIFFFIIIIIITIIITTIIIHEFNLKENENGCIVERIILNACRSMIYKRDLSLLLLLT